MIDRENAIENLEQNIRWIEEIECHQFPGWANVTMAMRDAAELLKEQEPVKPIVEQYALPLSNISVRFIKKYYCGICKEEITGNNVFCHKCGRKVKWDEAD